MTRYLTKAQVRELLFMLDGERYDDIDNYRELKRILFILTFALNSMILFLFLTSKNFMKNINLLIKSEKK